jgi:cytochrome c biogenesis protein
MSRLALSLHPRKARRLVAGLVAHAGSLRATLAGLGLLAAVVLARPAWQPLALVIAALSINLLAALVQHPGLRRRLPLLVAHLALLALVTGVAIGRLSALDGRFELTQGVAFDGQLIDQASGPLYRQQLHRLAFRHEGFEIDYAPGRKRGATRNTVAWVDEAGQPQQAVIGDHHPLVLAGHRITTSPNKGFAPLLRWLPDQGAPLRGAVHLPSFPVHELRQSREWALPDGRSAWVLLQTDETLLDPQVAGSFRMPQQHRLVVRIGEQRAELVPGQGLRTTGGTLVYEGLRTWMGYRVAYDPTLPWLLAAALLAALALGAHYVQKFWFTASSPTSSTAPAPRSLGTPGVLDG